MTLSVSDRPPHILQDSIVVFGGKSDWPGERLGSNFMRKILAALLFVSCAAAQSDRGGMTGRVTDPSGAAISGAEISLVSEATSVKYSTKSSETGNYLIGSLPFGRYSA